MSWLRSHKLLVVVYAAMLLLAVFELTDADVGSVMQDEPATFLEPERNIADVSRAVHPNRALTLYNEANQAALCGEAGAARHSVCRARGPIEPGEVRELLEEAIATGNRSVELAMYNYAWVLLQEGASPEQVDAAVAAWRSAHPRSVRPDPRVAYREHTQRR
jgi:hypothetical protein